MSSSGAFWTALRWRVGGSDTMFAQIHDLIQKQINANADAADVTVEDILSPVITTPSKVVLRDHLHRSSAVDISIALSNLMPVDPDLSQMRLWIPNDHGGRYLRDQSMMGNRIQLNGSDQSKLIFSTDTDAISNDKIVNQFIDDQYVRVEDKDASPNLNVRIKEIAATATGITIFIRLFIQRNRNDTSSGSPGVLFSKIDTEQADYGYAAYLRQNGQIIFIVREAGREYTLSSASGSITWVDVNLPDYLSKDYSANDYNTILQIPAPPDPIPYADLGFTYTFSTKRMQILKNGVIIKDSNSNPEASGLVAEWRLNEGGDIGNTPDAPSSYSRTIYNSVATGNNGLVTAATWYNPPTNLKETYLYFNGATHNVNVTSYTAIQNLSAWTISFWYYPIGTPAPDGYIVRKGAVLTSNAWLVYHTTNNVIRFSVWNSAGTRVDISSANNAVSGRNVWYHIVAKVTLASTGKVFVNNTKVTGGTVSGTVDTGSGNPLFLAGSATANSPNGLIHDVKIFNRELSDVEVTTLFNDGHTVSLFPPWKANPPTTPPTPTPITNPFVSVYQCPSGGGLPVVAEQDAVRLHAIVASSLTEKYNVGQGAQQDPQNIGETPIYDNDPTYDSGTAVQEVISGYSWTTTAASQYMLVSASQFGGEKIQTGSDIIGKPITKVVVKLADVNPTNTPATGTMVAKIKKASDGSTAATSSTVTVSTVIDNQAGASAANYNDITFTFSGNTYNMVNNDRIQFEYNYDSDSGGGGGGGAPPGGIGVLPSGSKVSYYSFLTAARHATQSLFATAGQGAGEQVSTIASLIADAVTGIVIKLSDAGSPAASGNVVCKIKSSGGTTKGTSTNTINATQLADNSGGTGPGSWTDVGFTFSPTVSISSQDTISIEYNMGGSGGSGVGVATTNGSATTEGTSVHLNSSGGVTLTVGNDVCMDVYA